MLENVLASNKYSENWGQILIFLINCIKSSTGKSEMEYYDNMLMGLYCSAKLLFAVSASLEYTLK